MKESAVVSIDQTAALDTDPTIRKVLPRVFIDGPFGGTPDIFKHEIAVLIAAGTGITPFASILKSTWYRMNYPYHDKLRKVYFFWICDDESLGWFWSLLMAIEAQDMDNNIEVHTVGNLPTYLGHA